MLSSKKDRLTWLKDNWPVGDGRRVYPADLADIWGVSTRTVSRYLAEIEDKEE